jgi:hypothetical protein
MNWLNAGILTLPILQKLFSVLSSGMFCFAVSNHILTSGIGSSSSLFVQVHAVLTCV